MSNAEQFSPFNPDGIVKYYDLLQTSALNNQRNIINHLLTTLERPVSRNELHLLLATEGITTETFDSWFIPLLAERVIERRYISGMGTSFVMDPVVRNNFNDLLNSQLFTKPEIPPEEKVGYAIGLWFTENYNLQSSQNTYIDPESFLGIFRRHGIQSIDDIYTMTCRTRVSGIILKKSQDKELDINQEAAKKMRLRYVSKLTRLAQALGMKAEKRPSLNSLIFEQNLAKILSPLY